MKKKLKQDFIIDIREIPFSKKGSYMAISQIEEDFHWNKNLEKGLYLRSIHGGIKNPFIARIFCRTSQNEIVYDIIAHPENIDLVFGRNNIKIVYYDENRILFSGKGKNYEFVVDFLNEEGYDYIYPMLENGELFYLVNCFKNNSRYAVCVKQGKAGIEQKWEESGCRNSKIAVESDSNGEFLLSIEEIKDSVVLQDLKFDIMSLIEKNRKEYIQFFELMPDISEEYDDVKRIVSYVNWSSIVNAEGLFKRQAMLMSKNWMCNVWSWDHCFNAMCLSYKYPEEAWNQFMIMFDYQTPTGRLPDSVNDVIRSDNFCKPPIHGWAFSKIRKNMHLSNRQLSEAYDKMSKWTKWWLNFRDQDKDGLCEYTHGNDSGWDNSTAFSELPPVTLPDLATFLILQMDELAEIASILHMENESEMWNYNSQQMLTIMQNKLFDKGRPIALQTITQKEIRCESLILFLPILLGKKLNKQNQEYLITELKSDRFRTKYGFATESLKSKLYRKDGYWRGPIWGPSTMLIVDGLWKCGETTLAKEITKSFIACFRKGGCSENYDAITGEGLRDRAYTWTGSIALLMLKEYV